MLSNYGGFQWLPKLQAFKCQSSTLIPSLTLKKTWKS